MYDYRDKNLGSASQIPWEDIDREKERKQKKSKQPSHLRKDYPSPEKEEKKKGKKKIITPNKNTEVSLKC